LNGGDGFRAQAPRILLELVQPEVTDLRALDPGHGGPSEARVVEEAQDVGKRGLRLIEEGEECVPEDMLHARPPGVGPNFLEGLEQAGGDERT